MVLVGAYSGSCYCLAMVFVFKGQISYRLESLETN